MITIRTTHHTRESSPGFYDISVLLSYGGKAVARDCLYVNGIYIAFAMRCTDEPETRFSFRHQRPPEISVSDTLYAASLMNVMFRPGRIVCDWLRNAIGAAAMACNNNTVELLLKRLAKAEAHQWGSDLITPDTGLCQARSYIENDIREIRWLCNIQ